MKASDIIRELLCLIDVIDANQQGAEQVTAVAVDVVSEPVLDDGERRFKQIFDFLSSQQTQMYVNSPAEVTAGIESVTTNAGGGWNGPKNPANMRADSVALYPNKGK
jgi:hypothetical protein